MGAWSANPVCVMHFWRNAFPSDELDRRTGGFTLRRVYLIAIICGGRCHIDLDVGNCNEWRSEEWRHLLFGEFIIFLYYVFLYLRVCKWSRKLDKHFYRVS